MKLSLRLARCLPFLLALVTSPCWAGGLLTIEQVVKEAHDGVEYMGNDELVKRINANPKLILLDVRTKEEYDAGHLKGATWVERGVAEFVLARTLRDPGAEVVVYCKGGNRSGLVVKALKRVATHQQSWSADVGGWLAVAAHRLFVAGPGGAMSAYTLTMP